LFVEHIGLAAVDPSRLKDWYVAALSGEVVYTDGKTPPAFLIRLPGSPLMIEIYASEKQLPDTANNRLAGWRHLALGVDSIEQAQAALAGRGVQFEQPIKPAGGGGRVLFLRDPEGNLLHLVERPPGALAGER
jgi:catechol 2,3-dioxygenase-like lactoylglutathione lyase family enzyme